MSTEQLKMILDALQAMGAAGKDAFIWWLLLDKLPGFIGFLCFLGVAYLVVRMLIRYLSGTGDMSAAKRAASAMNDAWLSSHLDMEAYRLRNEVAEWASRKAKQ